ncbi:RHS repeat-associated core domain-containing protein [Microbulbifer donghaiensis]|uniref:RHS repeat-associated core domain-containing protein n=1 Tax=Microbulbifer donghaiensis TaxID=494016 RepID=UPI001F3D2A65|nr:RHS repeat-associated core domain-containing protein [Microbulbifer donghaiensis]
MQVRFKPSKPSAPSSDYKSTDGIIVASWSKPSGTASYYKLQGTKSNNWSSPEYVDGYVGTTSQSSGGFGEGDWKFRVSACNQFSWACSSYSSASGNNYVRFTPGRVAQPGVVGITIWQDEYGKIIEIEEDDARTTDGAATVTWDTPTGNPTYYDVQAKEINGGSWINAAANTSGNSAPVSSLTDGYWNFRVRACNEFSWACSSYSPENIGLVEVRLRPDEPDLVAPANSTSAEILLSWNRPSGNATYYQLYKSSDGTNFGLVDANIVDGGNTINYPLSEGEGDYYYRVLACNLRSWACTSVLSADTSFTQVRFKPPIPGKPSDINSNTTTFTVDWPDVAPANLYFIEKRVGSGPYAGAGQATTSQSPQSGQDKDELHFKVAACNDFAWACSAFSSENTVRVRKSPAKPAPPSAPSQTLDQSALLTFSEAPASGEYYKVLSRKGTSGTFSEHTPGDKITTDDATVTGLSDGYWSFQLVQCNGFEWACSEPSAVSASVEARQLPQSVWLNLPAEGKPRRSYSAGFSASSTVTSWDLEERLFGDVNWNSIYTGQAGSASITKTIPDESWEYQLTACNTSIACVTTPVSLVDIVQLDFGDILDDVLPDPVVPEYDSTVGHIDPEVTVSGGSSILSIPIIIPPGRAALQPSVKLNYSSNSGNGILGMGWSLSTGGSIDRCADIYALDGSAESVSDDSQDKLCINGVRLILDDDDGTYGDSGSVYYPETNPAVRIVQSGALSGASFSVDSSNGVKKYFGDTENSRVRRGGSGSTISWKLRKIQDLHNNSVIYSYYFSGGASYLSKIFYTGDGDTQGNREVSFTYEDRDDVISSYRNKSEVVADIRLKSISTYVDGSPVREYSVYYREGTNVSKIDNIQLCGWGAVGAQKKCYPSTVLDWTDWDFVLGSTPTKVLSISEQEFDSPISSFHDYDGDGTPDFSLGTKVTLSSSGQEETLPYRYEIPGGLFEQSKSFSNSGFDIDLDGRVDNIGLSDGKLRYARWNGSSFVEGDTGVSYECVNYPYDDVMNDPSLSQFRACSAYSLDFNGDGIQDLVTTYQSSSTESLPVTLRFYEGSENGTFVFVGSSPNIKIDKAMVVADYDGNGLEELIGVTEEPLKGSNKVIVVAPVWNNGVIESIATTDTGVSVQYNVNPLFFDANNDGLLDVLVYQPAVKDWRLYENSGGDLTSDSYLVSWEREIYQEYFHGERVERYLDSYIRVMDFNRDGISDLVYPSATALHQVQCEQFQTNGCQFWINDNGYGDKFDIYSWSVVLGKIENDGKVTFSDEVSLPVIAPLTDISMVDQNGDSYADILTRFGRTLNDNRAELTMAGPYSQPGIYVYYNQSSDADLVTGISTALGVRHEFSYQSLRSSPDFYNVTNTNHAFPVINGSTATMAVKEYRTSDGLGGLNKTTFSYKDALFNLQGRGHQGFREITERKFASDSDTDSYAEVVTTFAQDFPETGSVLHQDTKVRNNSGTLVTTAVVDNQLTVVNGQLANTKFVYADTSTTTKKELDGSLISTESVTRTYHYLGLLTDETSVVSDNSGDVTKTTTKDINFTLDTANWWFKLDNASERHQISYQDPLQLPAGALTDVTVTKTYGYTDSGTRQPTSITTTSDDTSLNLVTTNRYTGPYKQLDRVTLTSNGSGNTAIEGSRWTEMSYSTGSDDGYFVVKTYNSAWGLTVAANSATYDARTGLPLTQTDANGHTTNNKYDHFGHLTEADAPGVPAQKLSRQWCSAGCPSAATSRHAVYFQIAAQAGAPMVLSYYDALGREVYRETEGTDDTIVQWQSYDSRGRVTQVVDPHYSNAAANDYGSVDFSQFDGLSRPGHKSVSRLPISYEVNYDYSGLTTDITVTPNGLGPVLMMASRSSVLGQPMYHRDAKGQFTRFRYDALGNVAMIQDVSGNAITATYNGFGHKLALNDPNMGGWQFLYNTLGELRWQRDAKAQVSTFNYDALGRLTDAYPGSDAAHHFQFDDSARGTLDREYTGSSSSPDFERIYSYDSLQRETVRTSQIDGRVFVQETAWDANYGRIKGVQYPDGTIVETLYDQTGRVAEDWDFVAGVQLRTVDSRTATDAITQQSFANALIEESQYNAAGLLNQRCVSSIIGNCAQSNLIYDQYDSYGNLWHRRNAIAGVDESFVYDELHRLTQSSRSWDTHIPATLHATVDYGYDAAGNLLYKSDFSDTGNAYQYGDVSRAINNAGPNAVTQVTLEDLSTRTFHYDLNGNLTADGLRTISYGVNNKPRSISHSNGNSASYYYGPDDSRYKQVATDGSATTTRYYLGTYEYEETLQGGNTTVVERTTVADFAQYRTETLNGSVQSTGWQFLHKDHLGSIESISDIAGSIQERRGFDPFGKVRDLNEDDSNGGLLGRDITRRGFSGHEHLDGVELIHMNGRAYDYNLGRFLSVDPFISMPGNSQAYNPYSYVMNNPLRYTDPTGYVVNLAGTNEAVTDEAGQQVEQAIEACNSSTCGGVEVKLSDGTTVVYLKGNGNGGGKIGAVAVSSPRDNENRSGANNASSGQSNEVSVNDFAPRISAGDSGDGREALSTGKQEFIGLLEKEITNTYLHLSERRMEALRTGDAQLADDISQAMHGMRIANWKYVDSRGPDGAEALAETRLGGMASGEVKALGVNITFYQGSYSAYLNGSKAPRALGYFVDMKPGLHAVRGIIGHEVGHTIPRNMVQTINGRLVPLDQRPKERAADTFLRNVYPGVY